MGLRKGHGYEEQIRNTLYQAQMNLHIIYRLKNHLFRKWNRDFLGRKGFTLIGLAVVFFLGASWTSGGQEKNIRPWSKNRNYWQFKGKPLLLLGASDDDNLFQWPAEILIPHLDSMKAIGANYVRNTMSDRKDRGFECYPFKKLENGKYDLEQWNDAYWERFSYFLEETRKRNIIVQIEVWDRFDYSREHWLVHPYNPVNNINYSAGESKLAAAYPDHPGLNRQPFFFTTPNQKNNEVILKYQVRFVEKMLAISLEYDHVLYCIDNETSAEGEWPLFWAQFILDHANAAGKEICITEMWDDWNLRSDQHKRTFDHPDLYAFCDVSQNNQQKGQAHWDNFQWVKKYTASHPRPLNTVKTYGADGGSHGSTKDGLERWWRHLLGGAAAARFHRPTSGLGLSELSMNSVRSARRIEEKVKFWELSPSLQLLSDRQKNEVYLACNPGKAYLLFFTDGGEAGVDLKGYPGKYSLQWVNVRTGQWLKPTKVTGGAVLPLKAPDQLEWIALLLAR